MPTRDPAIQALLTAVRDALGRRDLGPDGAAAVDRVYAALATVGEPATRPAMRRPVCDSWLPPTLEAARHHGADLARVADAVAAIEPSLHWAPRAKGGLHASANWLDGHANGMIVGPGGIEERDDLQIGLSVMAPHVRYPDHTHPPEEVYLVLSPGRFQHGPSDWFEPGIGGTLYNSPGIRHAMASDEAPLLALWLLPVGTPAAATIPAR